MSNGDIVKGVYESFAKGDIPAVLGTMAENIEWTEAEGFPYGGTFTGPNAVLEYVFMKLGTEWEGWSAVPEQILDAGETIVSLGNYTGKYNETGKSINVPFAHVWTFNDDGKAVKFVQYTDTLKISEAL